VWCTLWGVRHSGIHVRRAVECSSLSLTGILRTQTILKTLHYLVHVAVQVHMMDKQWAAAEEGLSAALKAAEAAAAGECSAHRLVKD